MNLKELWEMAEAKAFTTSEKASVSTNAIIGIMMVLIFSAYLLPVGLTAINAVNTSAWTTAQASLFSLIGLFAVIGIVMKIVRDND